MDQFKSEFLRTLVRARLLHQVTDAAALDAAAAGGRITGYIGFDATADSLHVGSLVQIMLLRHLQRSGHRPIVLMGGGTTKIGDPSGRDETRQLLTDAQIDANIAASAASSTDFLRFDDDPERGASWPTTTCGSRSSNTSRCCATSAAISPSTAC